MGKRPKQREAVRETKVPRARPTIRDGQIRISFLLFDAATLWADKYDDSSLFHRIAHKVKNYESMRWTDVHVRDHYVPFSSLVPEAQKRILTLQLDDFDGLWRFRFDGSQRLWGLRWDDWFYALWWDPEHKVCPSTLKHT